MQDMAEQLPAVGTSEVLLGNDVFTGETLVDEYAGRIATCWHKTTETIFALAHACADADHLLPASAKKALIAKLPFDRATFSKLVRIGNDRRLAAVATRLPQSFSTLYELSKLGDGNLDAAIKKGAIHPALTRREVLDLVAEHSTGSSDKISVRDKSKFAELRALWKRAPDADRRQFIEWAMSEQ
jgi:hypothetical protein